MRARPLERWLPTVFVMALLGQAILLWSSMGACAGGADSSGYLNTARLLAQGKTSATLRTIAAPRAAQSPDISADVYTPLGFRPMLGNGKISSIYPIGLPLLIAATSMITSWQCGPGLVIGLHAILGVLVVYALGRCTGLSPGWSALGSLILGASPLYIFLSLQVFSDVPALVWTTMAALAAFRARDNPRWAVAAGATWGIAVLVRPTDVLALLPIALLLGPGWRRIALFVAGGLPMAVLFCAYGERAYGSAFSLGYFNPPDSFALHRVDSTFWRYLYWLPVLLTPVVTAIVALPWAKTASKRWRLVLGVWIVVFLGFYSTYLFTHMTWWFLRFLLPAFPPLIVGALHVLRSFSGRRPGRIAPAAAWCAVSCMVLLHGALWTRALHARYVGAQERRYRDTAQWMTTHLPADSIVCAMQDSGALFYYTGFTVVRWDWLQPRQFAEIVRMARADRRPLYAALQHSEETEGLAFTKHIPGNWQTVGQIGATTVWRFEPGP